MKNQSQNHELSFNKSELNLNLLIQTAEIAVYSSRVECEREIGKFQNASFGSQVNQMKNSAASLASAASNLSKAMNTLHALVESKTRDNVIIIKE